MKNVLTSGKAMILMPRETFVTLTTNDTYSIGALVLGHSLRLVNTQKELTVLITEGVPHSFRDLLRQVYDNIIVVKQLQSSDNGSTFFLNRPNLGTTYTKLHCWTLTDFSKAVFLDADIIALQNIDDLFDYEEFSAAPDTSWPDMFNSGVFVFKPSLTTYQALLKLASTESSFDGGDQGLLNEYFKDWNHFTLSNHLPFAYNCSCWVLPNDINIFYTRAPAWKKFNSLVKAAHFTGIIKPWTHRMVANDGAIIYAMNMIDCAANVYTTAEQIGVLAFWWAVFFKFVKPLLSEGMFLATTWDPVLPVPPPSPLPPAPWQPPQSYEETMRETEFWNKSTNYHPEFHDTSLYDVYAGQRTDQTGAYKDYHEFQVNDPSPKEPEHHRYYHHHHHQQQQHHHQHHNSHQEQQHQQKPDYHHDHHHQQHQMHYEPHQPKWQSQQPQQHHAPPQGDQHWEKKNHSWSATEHPQSGGASEQNATPPVPDDDPQCKICHPDSGAPPTEKQQQQQPLPEAAAEKAPAVAPEVKTPLYYAPRASCSECLREMQWSRLYIDPINHHLVPEVYPLPNRATHHLRIRPRSIPMRLANLQYYQPTCPGANGKEQRQEQQKQPQKKAEPEKVKKPEHAMRGVAREKVAQSKLHQVQKPRPQETAGKKRPSRTAKAKLPGDGPVKETPLKRFMLEDPCTVGRAKAWPLPLKTLPDVKKTGVAAQEKGSEPLKTDTILNATDAAGKATEERLLRKALMPLCETLPSVKEKDLSNRDSVKTTAIKKVTEEEKSFAKRTVDPFNRKPSAPLSKSKPPKVPSPKGGMTPVSTRDKSRRAADLSKVDVTETTNRPKKSKGNEESRQPVLPPAFSFPQLDAKTPSPTAKIKKSSLTKKALPKSDSFEGLDFGTHAKLEAPWFRAKQHGMNYSRSIPHMSHVETEHLCERHRPRPPPPEWKMYAWERGEIDYMGSDRFCNILARIHSTIQEVGADNLPIGTWL